MYNKKPSKLRSILIFTFVAAIFIGALIYAWDFFITQKVVKIIPSSNTSIEISSTDTKKEIIKTTNTKDVRLRPGKYLFTYSGTSEYQEKSEKITISSSIEIRTPSLSYTDQKLSQLLEAETATIQDALFKTIQKSDYSISSEKLYITGNWYGAQLKPINWYDVYAKTTAGGSIPDGIDSKDILKVIMEKVDGKWEVITKPSLVFSIDDYPKIPESVIRAVDKLGL